MTMTTPNTCLLCGKRKPANELVPSYSPFFPNYVAPFCYKCIVEKFDCNDLNVANRICQQLNAAFLPDDWVKAFKQNSDPETALKQYLTSVFGINYKTLDWVEQNERLMKLAENGTLENELEDLRPQLEADLRKHWGDKVEYEDLLRLEEQYNASIGDYNLSTDIQRNLLRKIVRMSLMIDAQLDEGIVDKDLLAQYKNLVKELTSSAEKTPDEGINSFSQVWERMYTLGFRPNFDYGEPKDRLDFAIKNIQDYNRDLFLGESLIQEQYEQTKQLVESMDDDELGGDIDVGKTDESADTDW